MEQSKVEGLPRFCSITYSHYPVVALASSAVSVIRVGLYARPVYRVRYTILCTWALATQAQLLKGKFTRRDGNAIIFASARACASTEKLKKFCEIYATGGAGHG